ncbi:MAG TPA: peptide chain release factor N(5)-glutamine methyltransferase [Polyangiaceae bacterium]|nr:peptide chain release factor N(5)-glutamine methyltransferase [Polyangiaceae bacterium]
MTSGERDAAASAPERVDPWTIRRVLTWATQDFAARGLASPGLEAELLLAHALAVPRIRLIADNQRVLSPPELQSLRALIQRRRSGEPSAYILGRREFYGLDFQVDSRVLIPRPDTETLIEVALRRTASQSLFAQVLDLCTGSGCVAIALGHARTTWRIIAADISNDALDVARNNALRLGEAHHVAFVHSDLFAALSDQRFDVITCNPPYIGSAEISALPVDVRDFEPRLALDGGDDGLQLIRKIVPQARRHLNPGGLLAMEVGAGQAPAVSDLFAENGFAAIELQRDYGGHQRVVSATTPQEP